MLSAYSVFYYYYNITMLQFIQHFQYAVEDSAKGLYLGIPSP